MRVLIVEDNYVDRYIFEVLIKCYGEYDVAKNGNSAIIKFKEAHDDRNPYDLIFLDIMIPKLNGYEVLLTIREYENIMKTSKLAVVVIVSALDDLDYIKKAFAEKCNAYITKPVSNETIKKTIKNLIDSN